ncbi:interleukin-32 isoform X1 [Pteropus medius]|uniref:interleukin-32 isoform X1 n=1 Tax=Pteropus vampyrus TaxID=132908 RepID=UPI00196AD7C1|nr:interleukin-32 isoform X1 [Pteropus giganteus]XP_039741042.1 interleukin-32 isoform X1 [Pteropus giganteus]XP_039741043.1 interleukin-32 isoform X1 [Pteropus giganteus]XP_039741045.1 interleukin-32 isoform X1 [Pteropus giganteus]
MCYNKVDPSKIEQLRVRMHKNIDVICNRVINTSEDQQVELALEELEDRIEEDMLDSMHALYQNDDQASTPLLLKEQQELRRRVQRPTLESEGPGVQQPGESFYDRLLRCFQKMLQRLQEIWQDVLTWVKEKAAHLCDTVKAIWNEVKSFFSSMEQLFLSPLQA